MSHWAYLKFTRDGVTKEVSYVMRTRTGSCAPALELRLLRSVVVPADAVIEVFAVGPRPLLRAAKLGPIDLGKLEVCA